MNLFNTRSKLNSQKLQIRRDSHNILKLSFVVPAVLHRFFTNAKNLHFGKCSLKSRFLAKRSWKFLFLNLSGEIKEKSDLNFSVEKSQQSSQANLLYMGLCPSSLSSQHVQTEGAQRDSPSAFPACQAPSPAP